MIDIPTNKGDLIEIPEVFSIFNFDTPVLNDLDFRDRCHAIFEFMGYYKRNSDEFNPLRLMIDETNDLTVILNVVRNTLKTKALNSTEKSSISALINTLENYIGINDDYINIEHVDFDVNKEFRKLLNYYIPGNKVNNIHEAVRLSVVTIKFITDLRDRYWSIFSNEYPNPINSLLQSYNSYEDKLVLLKVCIYFLRSEIDFREKCITRESLRLENIAELDSGIILKSRVKELEILHNSLCTFLDSRGASYSIEWVES